MKKNIFVLALGLSLTSTSQAGLFDGIKNFFSSEKKEETQNISNEGNEIVNEAAQSADHYGQKLEDSANQMNESANEKLQQQEQHLQQQQTSAPALTDIKSGIIGQVTSSLGVSEQQAVGGLGAIFAQAQSNLPAKDFSSLANHIPNISTLLSAAPVIADSKLGGLMSSDTMQKAAGSVSSASTLIKQFDALGLSKGMIPQFLDLAMGFLKQKGGAEASTLLQTALGVLG